MSEREGHRNRWQANRELRRQQLIEATLATVKDRGPIEATIGQIAAVAGFTGANLYRYFGDKEGLLVATMRYVVERGQAERRSRQEKAADPVERFLALIDGTLSPEVFRVDICRAWLHFLAQAPHVSALARLERLHQRLLRSGFATAAAAALPPAAAKRLTEETLALIEGLTVQRAQADEGMSPDAAAALVRGAALTHLLPAARP